MRPARRALIKRCGAMLVAVATLLVVLGTTAAATASASSAPPVTPNRWTRSVCRDIATWLKARGDAEARTAQTLAALTAGGSSAKAAKAALTRTSGRAAEATDALVEDVKAAGVPNVDGGKQVANAYAQTLTQYADAYNQARAAFAKARSGDTQSFSTAAQEINNTLAGDLATVGVDPVEELRAVPEISAAITASCGDVATYLAAKIEPPCQSVLSTARHLADVDSQEGPLPEDSPQLQALVEEEFRAHAQLQGELGGCNVTGVAAPCRKPFDTARHLSEVWSQFQASVVDSPQEQALYDELTRTYDALRNDLAAMCH